MLLLNIADVMHDLPPGRATTCADMPCRCHTSAGIHLVDALISDSGVFPGCMEFA